MTEDKPRRGRPPTGRGRLPIALTIKGRAEWREWLEAKAGEAGVSSTDLIDQGLARLAESKAWGSPPSRT